MNRRWVCNDVWLNILPFFDHAQLGLKLALLSPRFEALVDKHFDGKSEFTIWRKIIIGLNGNGGRWMIYNRGGMVNTVAEETKLYVFMADKHYTHLEFAFPSRPLPSKIRFKDLHIEYIDQPAISFLRVNKQIWDKGTNLHMAIYSSRSTTDPMPNWKVFVREIWPIFSANIHCLAFSNDAHLNSLRLLISPTILFDLNLNSVNSNVLFPDPIGHDGPNDAISAGQMLSKWLHTPTTDGRPKQLHLTEHRLSFLEWVNNFKQVISSCHNFILKAFRRATICANYKMRIELYTPTKIEPFELVNGWTNEKLSLKKDGDHPIHSFLSLWLLSRCPIGRTAPIQWEDGNSNNNLNSVYFSLNSDIKCFGPLSLPADQSDEKGFSTPGPSDQRNDE